MADYIINQKNTDIRKTVRKAAMRILMEMGISPRLSGFICIVEGICILYGCPDDARNAVAGLYCEIAVRCGSTLQRTERCMRTAVKKIKFTAINSELGRRLSVPDRLTVKKLLCILSEYLREIGPDELNAIVNTDI